MASQRITIAKIGGVAGVAIGERIRRWAATRSAIDKTEWSPVQWPADVHLALDELVVALRQHCTAPPVLYFTQWIDLWSMGDIFKRGLTPRDATAPDEVHSQRCEVLSYRLPDEGRLLEHLQGCEAQQFREYEWYVSRLCEATKSWSELSDEATLLVIRETYGGLVTDEDVLEALTEMPNWLT